MNEAGTQTVCRVGRLAGALLLDARGDFYLIGNLKRPCDFAAAGFRAPEAPIDATTRPFIRLELVEPKPLPGPWLLVPGAPGEALAAALAQRLLIERNGSVSDRLWRLILSPDGDPDGDPPADDATIDARWLTEVPLHLWQIVRDTVLKCS